MVILQIKAYHDCELILQIKAYHDCEVIIQIKAFLILACILSKQK